MITSKFSGVWWCPNVNKKIKNLQFELRKRVEEVENLKVYCEEIESENKVLRRQCYYKNIMVVPQRFVELVFNNSDCSICLQPFDGSHISNHAFLYCGHSFHLACIRQWMSVKTHCPVCFQSWEQ